MQSLPADGKTPYHEIFESLSGEGPTYGLPSIFIRFYGCNRECWGCDTGYSPDERDKRKAIAKRARLCSSDTIAAAINEHFDIQNRHIVITGGEPVLRLSAMFELFTLMNPGLGWSVETNGELIRCHDIFRMTKNYCQWIISPKFASTGKASEWQDFSREENVHYKFLVGCPGNIKELEKLADSFNPVNTAYVQPMDNDKDVLDLLAVSKIFKSPGSFQTNANQRSAPHPGPADSFPRFDDLGWRFGGRGVGVAYPKFKVSLQVHKLIDVL